MGRLLRDTSLTRADRRELSRIFVGASLPNDHPHAIQLPRQKPALFELIIKSPTLANKLRRRLSRGSLVSKKSFLSLRPHPKRLLHRQSRLRTRVRTVDDVAEDRLASTDRYDPDAHPVRISKYPVSSVARQKVITPAIPVRRQRIRSFEWLVSGESGTTNLSPCSGNKAPSHDIILERKSVTRSCSAPCLTQAAVMMQLLLVSERSQIHERTISAPSNAFGTFRTEEAPPSSPSVHRVTDGMPSTAMPPRTVDGTSQPVMILPATNRSADERQLIGAFSALLDCHRDRNCFDGRCERCRAGHRSETTESLDTTFEVGPTQNQMHEAAGQATEHEALLLHDLHSSPQPRTLDDSEKL
ncbi:hypothetical protein K461DRAFT_290586 [Myriangium duriaei CBS 260.36]|uniref:Uncharacterized protein n=1 Tax=Myriangium duriaei CBS 260.36 TaxID=1168546 RepID=A0A9P4J5P6_9PEZI|nr:hypothetical protein K461DRAFT_290586 [Myriangium duriaei CBS 260.36]